MEYLHILQNVLTTIGGGSGDPHVDYVRHVIPMVFWGSLFFMVWTLRPRSTQRDYWFLVAIASAYLLEQTQFIIKSVAAANVEWAMQPSVLTGFERLGAPLFTIWTGLNFWLLSVVTCRFIGFCKNNTKPTQYILTAGFSIVLVGAVVSVTWFRSTGDVVFQPFYTSLEWAVLCSLHIAILAFAVFIFWRVRSLSIVSRIAWVPFAFYLLSELFLMIGATSSQELSVWLLPISSNLKIWATPWFALLFWRYAIDQQRSHTLQLQQSDRMDGVGRLAAGVAHDFNNHLQAILGYATAGTLESKSSDQHQHNYNSILECVERSRVLVRLLTGFKREVSDDEITVISLSDMIFEIRPLINSLLGPTVKTDCYLDPEADKVLGGRSMLEQVIVNVVINARDAMPHGGTLTTKSQTLGTDTSGYSSPMIRLTISDTGTGLSASERNQVFEPFYTTKGTTGGTGLGLTASLAAIERMGGHMKLTSEVNQGTTLIIDIPASDQSIQSVVDEGAVVSTLSTLAGTERILLADDEPTVRHVAATFLQREGYGVVLARDGEHALKLLSNESQSIDLILLDVLMPNKDGYDTFLDAKISHPDIPVIFMTGNMDPSSCREPHEVHIAKPFKPQALLQAVRTKLNEHEKSKEREKPNTSVEASKLL